jgi:hypothetical protein
MVDSHCAGRGFWLLAAGRWHLASGFWQLAATDSQIIF